MNTSGENSSNMFELHGFDYNQEEIHHQHPQNLVSSSPILTWPLNPPPIFSPSLPPFPPLPPLPPPPLHPFYGDLYTRSRALQFPYTDCNLDPLGLSSFYNYMNSSSSSLPFGNLHGEIGKMSAQEIMDAKALAASKSHSEAERRRRERINAHLAKLRSLLPSTTKTDKASLLAEVIQHVKELKRQTLEIAEESHLPTESDELTVDATNDNDGRFIVKASLCCDDRSDLLPELIKALKALCLRTLKAEITTLGGRVKNVLVITGDENFDHNQQSIASIQDALRAAMEHAGDGDEQPPLAGGGIKRQRTTNLSTILEDNSV